MQISEIFQIAQAILLSLGGGAIIVFALSSWLGKVWAERLAANSRLKYEKELEHFKSELKKQSELNNLNYREKIDLYKEAIIPIIEFMERAHRGNGQITKEQFHDFFASSTKITAQLTMFSPKVVFDKYVYFLDYINRSVDGAEEEPFTRFRDIVYLLLSEIRKDIGVHTDEISIKVENKSNKAI